MSNDQTERVEIFSAADVFNRELIDYAGLFPPAKRPLDEVVNDFAGYLNGSDAGQLSRLVIPASRLSEFEKVAAALLPENGNGPAWRISALVPRVDEDQQAFDFSVSGIRQFNDRNRNGDHVAAVVDCVEVKTPTIDLIQETAARLRHEEFRVFFELPHQEDPAAAINTLAGENTHGRFFAKLRSGGLTADLIPSCEQVARFLFCCAENFLGMKATAGLHHPVRSEFNLTYEKDSKRAVMHGFVNMFSAMCVAFGCGGSEQQLQTILESTRPEDFQFRENELIICEHRISARKLAVIRDRFAISFGSCSFEEPKTEFREVLTISDSRN